MNPKSHRDSEHVRIKCHLKPRRLFPSECALECSILPHVDVAMCAYVFLSTPMYAGPFIMYP
jgi:hypothetical protein